MSEPTSDSLVSRAVELISRQGGPRPGESSLDAGGREELVRLLSQRTGPALRSSVQSILELAYYTFAELDSEPTALALVEVAATQKAALRAMGSDGEKLAGRVASVMADRGRSFRTFAGEASQPVSPSAPPPAGAVRNSPFARFALRDRSSEKPKR